MNDPIIKYFECDHLPEKLKETSKPFCELAKKLDSELSPSSELAAGLRKLMEAKDCIVRASL